MSTRSGQGLPTKGELRDFPCLGINLGTQSNSARFQIVHSHYQWPLAD
jgi:hypothetical protein